MILTINEIIKRFRTEGQCYKFNPKTIQFMATKLGYNLKRIGGKIGYDQSLITAITRHFNEVVEYDKRISMKAPQKALKQPQMGDYYAYNGERDNKDYEWEKNENKNMKQIVRLTEQDLYKIIKESVHRILKENYTNDYLEPGKTSIKDMFRDDFDDEYGDFRIYMMHYPYYVCINENIVYMAYYNEEKNGVPYHEYEDPDGSELDTIVMSTQDAWKYFLKECFDDYVNAINSGGDINDSNILNILSNFRTELEHSHPRNYNIEYIDGNNFWADGEN